MFSSLFLQSILSKHYRLDAGLKWQTNFHCNVIDTFELYEFVLSLPHLLPMLVIRFDIPGKNKRAVRLWRKETCVLTVTVPNVSYDSFKMEYPWAVVRFQHSMKSVWSVEIVAHYK